LRRAGAVRFVGKRVLGRIQGSLLQRVAETTQRMPVSRR